jgi:ABC-2 type transport system permease protein
MTASADPAPPVPTLSTPAAAWLVAKREMRARLRSRAFLVSAGILLAVVLAGVIVGGVLSATASATKVAVVHGAISATALEHADGISAREVPDRATAERLVRAGDVAAAIVPDDSTPLGFGVVAESSPPTDVLQQLSVVPPVHLLAPHHGDDLLRYLVALGFGLVFFMASMTFGQLIAQSVVEEKSTRIVEILLATISARALLAGKVIGTSILALGQIVLLVAVALAGLSFTGQTSLVGSLGAPLIWFAVFFVFGFVLLATMFAATGALVSRQEDVASTTTPVTLLVMLPYFLIIFLNGNDTAVAVMSYVPFSAPVGMPLRLFLGQAQWWEPLVSLAILLATTLVMLLIGARIYENALLKLGARVPWRQALAR